MSAPLILVMPGASLMQVTPMEGGVEVRCPGCGNVHRFGAHEGSIGIDAFVHQDDCAVHARIEATVRDYERAVVRRGCG